MIRIEAGHFSMGSDQFYADEGPVHDMTVAAFEIDAHPVTNAEFAAFIEKTGYITIAERPLDPAIYPDVAPEDLLPGALFFTGTRGPVDLSNWRQWWGWAPGASWRHPFGRTAESTVEARPDHPVVQVAYEDALAYAQWAGKRLATEAEWEFASRGGLSDHFPFAWGVEPAPGGVLMANTWQGQFPFLNVGANGWRGTSPVGSFPANGYGLVDMIGNVWEWTATDYTSRHVLPTSTPSSEACRCSPSHDARRVPPEDAACISEDGVGIRQRVLKGGSHLCSPEYCLRYRPAARSPQAEDTWATHIGFRCARSV